jgi:hypothetical protein
MFVVEQGRPAWTALPFQSHCRRDLRYLVMIIHRRTSALRLFEPLRRGTARKLDLQLTEYERVERYRSDHPNGKPMGHHNAVVRVAMREAPDGHLLRAYGVD